MPDQTRACNKSLSLLKLQESHKKEIFKGAVAEKLQPVIIDKPGFVRSGTCRIYLLVVEEISFCKMFLGIPPKEAAMSYGLKASEVR